MTVPTRTQNPTPEPPPGRRHIDVGTGLAAALLVGALALDWTGRLRGRHLPAGLSVHLRDRLSTPSAAAPVSAVTLPEGWDRGLDTVGYLESPWLAGTLGGLFVVAVAAVVWLWLRRRRAGVHPRHPVLRRTGVGALLAVLFVLFGSATANAYVGYVPTVGSLVGDVGRGIAGGSRIDEISIGAPQLHVPPGPAYVYLPPGYQSPLNRQKHYPVLYLIHGYPGASVDWVRAGDVQPIMDKMIGDRLIQPMIVVAPDASGGWLHDSESVNQVDGPQLETYLTQTVPQTIDGRYRTVANRSGRAIGGVSSGGYAALNLALRNQNVFAAALPMMPYGDPGAVLDSLFAGNKQLLEQNTPSQYIPTMTITRPVAMLLVAGTEDPQLPTAEQLHAQLRARDLPVALQVVPGATHTWRGATQDLPYGLVFVSQHLASAGEK